MDGSISISMSPTSVLAMIEAEYNPNNATTQSDEKGFKDELDKNVAPLRSKRLGECRSLAYARLRTAIYDIHHHNAADPQARWTRIPMRPMRRTRVN